MNSMQLKDKLKNIAKKNNIDFNDIIDCIEEMIKQSNYVVL